MSKVISQYFIKPNPGADLSKLRALIKESTELWKKHGGQVSVWSVVVGETGDIMVAVEFDSMEAYGKAADAFAADASVQEWRQRNTAAALGSWLGSNIVREIKL